MGHMYIKLLYLPCGLGEQVFAIWVICISSCCIYLAAWERRFLPFGSYVYQVAVFTLRPGRAGFCHLGHMYIKLLYLPCGLGEEVFAIWVICISSCCIYLAACESRFLPFGSYVYQVAVFTLRPVRGGFCHLGHMYIKLLYLPCGLREQVFAIWVICISSCCIYLAACERRFLPFGSYVYQVAVFTLRPARAGFCHLGHMYIKLLYLPCGLREEVFGVRRVGVCVQ